MEPLIVSTAECRLKELLQLHLSEERCVSFTTDMDVGWS